MNDSSNDFLSFFQATKSLNLNLKGNIQKYSKNGKRVSYSAIRRHSSCNELTYSMINGKQAFSITLIIISSDDMLL